MLKFDLRVKLGRVTSGAKIAVSAFNGYNRMMIAKVPNEDDKRCILANANVLNNTDYSISHQIP